MNEFRTQTSATECQLILDRQTEWQRRIRMIQTATRFLYVSTFYIDPDRYGCEFLDELLAARKRGVKINLIIDTFGQRLASTVMSRSQRSALKQRLNSLTNAGGQIVFYKPPKLLQRLLGSGYHIKIQVSDSGEALFASGNITRLSFEQWMEFALFLKGPVVAVMLSELMKLTATPLNSHQAFFQQIENTEKPGNKNRVIFKYLSYNPCDDPSAWSPVRQSQKNLLTGKFIDAINQAEKSILLTGFYFKPEPGLFRAIEQAAQAGIKVEIHHSHIKALEATKIAWIIASFCYRRLFKAGAEIYEHLEGQHTKFMLIDEKLAWLGSYNFEYAADDRLAEAVLVTSDQRIVSRLRQFFSELRADSKNIRVQSDVIARLPLWVKLYRLLSFPFRRWLQ